MPYLEGNFALKDSVLLFGDCVGPYWSKHGIGLCGKVITVQQFLLEVKDAVLSRSGSLDNH